MLHSNCVAFDDIIVIFSSNLANILDFFSLDRLSAEKPVDRGFRKFKWKSFRGPIKSLKGGKTQLELLYWAYE